MGNRKQRIKEIFDQSFETFKDRDGTYGDAHSRHGKILEILFPEGLHLKGKDDFCRFMFLNGTISKINRYANTFQNGGHEDSLIDTLNNLAMWVDYENQLKEKEQ